MWVTGLFIQKVGNYVRGYTDYITNIKDFEGVDLYNTCGIFSFCIQGKEHIAYGKSIVTSIVSIISRLERGQNLYKEFLDMYRKYGDDALSVTILYTGDYGELRAKTMEYIKVRKPELNYKNTGLKGNNKHFSEDHCESLSKSKIGEKHNRAKLTEEQVIEIKKLALYSNMTSKEIAALFDTSPGNVRKIKIGENWSHIKV